MNKQNSKLRGGRKAVATIRAKHGADAMSRYGAEGGKVRAVGKGFASTKVGPDGLTGRQRSQALAAAKRRQAEIRTRRKQVAQAFRDRKLAEDPDYFKKLSRRGYEAMLRSQGRSASPVRQPDVSMPQKRRRQNLVMPEDWSRWKRALCWLFNVCPRELMGYRCHFAIRGGCESCGAQG